MKFLSWEKFQPHWRFVLGFKILATLVMILLPLDLPHVWRQVDTLAVAQRYWLRWTIESDLHPIWPAVLNSGGFVGYTGMELPLLNLLLAPAFALGPASGMTLARLLLFAINAMLWLWAIRVWKGIRIAELDVGLTLRWLPLIGLSSIYWGRFIPDTPAMLLCLIASGILWRRASHPVGFALLTLGTLIKPPAIITCAILLLKPLPLRKRTQEGIPLLLAAGVTVIYYLKVVPYLNRAEANYDAFAVSMRDPLLSLLEFFSSPSKIYGLLHENIFFPGAAIVLALIMVLGRQEPVIRKLRPMLFLLALMLSGVAALDGTHSFIHAYYHMGLMPIVTLLVVGLLQGKVDAPHLRTLQSIMLALLVVSLLAQARFDVRGLWREAKPERMPALAECQELKQSLPELPWKQGQVFRTEDHAYPKLGLCFGERVGYDTKAGYGFYFITEAIPPDCEPIRKSKHIQVVRCSS